MKIVCRKSNGVLLPVDEEGIEALAKVRDGRDVMVEVTQSRNPRQHRLFFAILRFVQMHSERMADRSIREIKNCVKLATGLFDIYVDTETGKSLWVERSIAFEAMDQIEFDPFFADACNVVCKRWMPPGVTADDVRRELVLMVDGRHALPDRVA